MELFKHCLKTKGNNCYFRNEGKYDLSIPYFCGNKKKCRLKQATFLIIVLRNSFFCKISSKLNDDWALQTAKNNCERYYPVVGVLEEFNATLDALEQRLPLYFKSAKKLYHRDLLGMFSKQKAKVKHVFFSENYKKGKKKQLIITEDIRSYLKTVLVKEYEFYDWVKMRLFQQLKIS